MFTDNHKFKRVREEYMKFMDDMRRKNIAAHAASTAFFFFLSLVPMLMVICMILPYTPITEENLVNAVTDLTPAAVDPLARNVIDEVYQQSSQALSVVVFAMLWSAAQGVLALIRGLNAINGVDEEKTYIAARGVATLYTFIMILAIMLSLFVMVFGKQLVHLVLHRVPKLSMLVSFYMEFRFITVWGVLTLLFAVIYACVPGKRLNIKEQIPGGCFSAVVWSIFSWGFSLYVSRSGAYSIYGSLSIIIIAMIWMYLGMYIVLIGAYLNYYFSTPEHPGVLGTIRNIKDETGYETR